MKIYMQISFLCILIDFFLKKKKEKKYIYVKKDLKSIKKLVNVSSAKI